MFFSYPSKDIKTKYSYEHVHRVLIKDRINKVVQRSRVLVLTTQFPALFHFPQIFKYFCLIIKGEPYVQAHNEDSQLKQKLASESNTSSSHVPLQPNSAARTVGNTFQSFPCPQTREPRKTPRTVSELFSASPISC